MEGSATLHSDVCLPPALKSQSNVMVGRKLLLQTETLWKNQLMRFLKPPEPPDRPKPLSKTMWHGFLSTVALTHKAGPKAADLKGEAIDTRSHMKPGRLTAVSRHDLIVNVPQSLLSKCFFVVQFKGSLSHCQ